MDGVKLTRRGEIVAGITGLTFAVLVMGFVGWLDTLGL